MSNNFEQIDSPSNQMYPPESQSPLYNLTLNNSTKLPDIENKKSQFVLRSQKSQVVHRSERLRRLNYVQQLLHTHAPISDQRRINRKVYILYTSGCVGSDQKLQIRKDYLKEKMMMNTYLCDYKLTLQSQEQNVLIVSPVLENGYRIQYSIQSMPNIQSSINYSIKEVVMMATKIKENYHKYDAFIFITGFDLMCYIATLLSFMLQNLSKCVIFTGGHFPVSYVRNDFINNIIQSFSIISLSRGLNDVIIVCKNKAYRANRSIKVKQSQLDTIKSPNMHSLASIDIKIILGFKGHLFLPIPVEPFNVFTNLSEKVHVLKFHLFMNKQTLKYELKNPNIIGYVIESYTAANLPEDPQFLEIFKEASQNYGKIFVNISQNIQKEKKSIMKEYLQRYQIYFGGDMTVQAGLAKLSYLIGKGYSKEIITEKISMNLRGQITQTKLQNQFQIQAQGFMQAVQEVLQDYYPTAYQKVFLQILEDQIGKYISKQTTPDEFRIIYKNSKLLSYPGQINVVIDRNFLLHQAVFHENIPLIAYFLSLPIDRDGLDQNECSAFFYAIKSYNKTIIQILHKTNCHVICPIDDLMDFFIGQLKKDNAQFFELLYHIEFKHTLCDIMNIQKRNVAHLAVLLGAQKCLEIFLQKYKFQFTQKDSYGSTIEDYIALFKKKNSFQTSQFFNTLKIL